MPQISSHPKKTMAMQPTKFLLWLFLLSMTMFFAALTSAYLVKRSQGDWISFEIPSLFGYTLLCILCSSLSMQLAYVYAKRNELALLKVMLLVTFLLGMLFLWGQIEGWNQLVASEVYLVGNPSGSFVYVLSGSHAVHLVGGLIFLIVLLKQAFSYKVHSEKTQQIEMCTTYWHFVGILWAYLYFFFLINQ